MATLDKQPTGGWAVSTLRLYTVVGLEPIGEAGVDRELPGSHAALDGGDLTVTVPMFSWSVGVEAELRRYLHDLGAVFTVLSTSFDPDAMHDPAHITAVLRSGQALVGRVPLRASS